MSIQSSINQMLSSVANQQLFKGLTNKVGEIKTDTAEISEEQKKINELIQKYGTVQGLTDAATAGAQTIEDELEARKQFQGFDDAVTGMTDMLKRIKNTAQTRVNMQQILAEDTQDNTIERLNKYKGGVRK